MQYSIPGHRRFAAALAQTAAVGSQKPEDEVEPFKVPHEDVDSMRVSAPPDTDAMRVVKSPNDPTLECPRDIPLDDSRVPAVTFTEKLTEQQQKLDKAWLSNAMQSTIPPGVEAKVQPMFKNLPAIEHLVSARVPISPEIFGTGAKGEIWNCWRGDPKLNPKRGIPHPSEEATMQEENNVPTTPTLDHSNEGLDGNFNPTSAKFSLADGGLTEGASVENDDKVLDVNLPEHWASKEPEVIKVPTEAIGLGSVYTPGDSTIDTNKLAQLPTKTLPNGQAVSAFLVAELPDLGGFYIDGKVFTADMKTVREATISEKSACELVIAEQREKALADKPTWDLCDTYDGYGMDAQRPTEGFKPNLEAYGHLPVESIGTEKQGTDLLVETADRNAGSPVRTINGVDVIPLKDVATPDGIKPFADGKIVGVFDQNTDNQTLVERLGEPDVFITRNLEKEGVAEPTAWMRGLNLAVYAAGSLENKIFLVNQQLRLRISEYVDVPMSTRMKHRGEVADIKPDDWYRVAAALIVPAMIAMEPKAAPATTA